MGGLGQDLKLALARLLEEPGLRRDRDPHARARQRSQHRHLHAARPGDAADAARRAARAAGGAERARAVLRLVRAEQRQVTPVSHPMFEGLRDKTQAFSGVARAHAGRRPPRPQGRHRARERRPGLGRLLPGARAASRARPALHSRRRPRSLGPPDRGARATASSSAASAAIPSVVGRTRERQQPPDDDRRRGARRASTASRWDRRSTSTSRSRCSRSCSPPGATGWATGARASSRCMARLKDGVTLDAGQGRGEPRLRAAAAGGLGPHQGRLRELQGALLQEDSSSCCPAAAARRACATSRARRSWC